MHDAPGEWMKRCKRRLSAAAHTWALLAVSIGFCALGVFVLLKARTQWRTAVMMIVFFGACALVFSDNVRRKLREQQWENATVQVVGGVNIYMNAPRTGYGALGCFIVGATIFFVGTDAPWHIRGIGALIALLGVGVAIAAAMGYYKRQFIRFEPDALIVGQPRFRVRIDWGNIAQVISFDLASNPFVGVLLGNSGAVSVDPPARRAEYQRFVLNNSATMKVDVVLMPRFFGIDGPALAAALQRYALHPAARAELARGRIAEEISSESE